MLGFSLGARVDGGGRGRVGFEVTDFFAVEDSSGGGEEKTCADLRAGVGDVLGTVEIDFSGEDGVALATVDIRDGSEEEDVVRTGGAECGGDLLFIGDVDDEVGLCVVAVAVSAQEME